MKKYTLKIKFIITDKVEEKYSAVFSMGSDFPLIQKVSEGQVVQVLTDYFKTSIGQASYCGKSLKIIAFKVHGSKIEKLKDINMKCIKPDESIQERGLDKNIKKLTFHFHLMERTKKHTATFQMDTSFPIYELYDFNIRRDLISAIFYQYIAMVNQTSLAISSDLEIYEPGSGKKEIQSTKNVLINKNAN